MRNPCKTRTEGFGRVSIVCLPVLRFKLNHDGAIAMATIKTVGRLMSFLSLYTR